MQAGDRGRAAALAELDVSRETIAKLDAYVALIDKWQPVQNLVSTTTLAEIWPRHIVDSAQLLPLLGDARRIADLGSGAGLPGLVLAILSKDVAGRSFDLIESNQRKAAFLTEVIRVTQVHASVHPVRIDRYMARACGPVDVVTARALASLDNLLAWSEPLLTTGARAIFPKGQDVEQELTQAAKSWRIVADLIPSQTDGNARIVHVREAERLRADGSRYDQ